VKALIDGDLILYKACAAVEREAQLDSENHILWSNAEEAYELAASSIEALLTKFGTEDHLIAFTEGKCFRYDLFPNYKGNRASGRKPLCMSRVKAKLKAEYNCHVQPSLEADDILGILGSRDPESTVICSIDKDMRSVPCTLFAGEKVERITEAEADYFHMLQTLTGDTSDGYPGCKGIGAKRAEALLDAQHMKTRPAEVPYGRWLWEAVVVAYEKAGLTEADALLQARLARIIRDSDWDSTTKQVKLWKP